MKAVMWMKVLVKVGIWVSLIGLAGLTWAQSSKPLKPIPKIAMESLSVPIRSAIIVAEEELEALEAVDPDPRFLAGAYGRLGDVLLVHGLTTPAEVAYINAQVLDPNRVDWPYLLSVIASDRGDVTLARRLLDGALEIDPWDRASLMRRGRLALDEGQWDQAEQDFSRVLQLAPDSAAAAAGLGELALQRQDYPEAVRQLESALGRQPMATRLYQPLALAYRGLGELDQARSLAGITGDRDVAFRDPVMDRVREQSQSPQFYQESALQAAEMGDLLSARTLLVQALSLAPNDPLIVTNYGEILAREGLLPQAQEAFTRLVELEPNSSDAWFYLAQTEELLGQLSAAEGAYSRMLSLSANDSRAKEGLAFVSLAKGEYRRAVGAFADLAASVTEPQQSYRFAYWHAISQIGLASYAEAMEQLIELDVQSNGQDADVVLALARLQSSVIQTPEAELRRGLARVESFYQENPNADRAATLAMIHARLGEFFDAQDYQAQAMFDVLRLGGLDRRSDLKEEMEWYRQEQVANRPFGKSHPLFSHRTLNE